MARRVVVIGAGVGGLAAALDLAARGADVTVVDGAAAPGGKLADIAADAALLSLPEVFEELFASAGARFADHVRTTRLPLSSRHVFADGSRLDLPAEVRAAADAIGALAGPAEARGYLAVMEQAKRCFETLERAYLRAPRPSQVQLAAKAGVGKLLATDPFNTLWAALAERVKDARIRQALARMTSWIGSSPFQAPATLLLLAHVEARGVHEIEGGAPALTRAMAALATTRGVALRLGVPAAGLLLRGGRVAGVKLADGEQLPAEAAIAAFDPASVAAGALGPEAARAVPPLPRAHRSLSVVSWRFEGAVSGPAPARLTVFHPADTAAEFRDLLARGRLPAAPTVTLAAPAPGRFQVLVSAPARGELFEPEAGAVALCREAALATLARAGLTFEAPRIETTGPAELERRFPGTGGALYGRAVHGYGSVFDRPSTATALPGLLLAGAGTHPGAGMANAALSGRLAAAAALAG